MNTPKKMPPLVDAAGEPVIGPRPKFLITATHGKVGVGKADMPDPKYGDVAAMGVAFFAEKARRKRRLFMWMFLLS